MERITLVGMGPISVSIGLALKKAGLNNTEVVGTSSNREALSGASKLGAVDKTIGNLRTAIEGAQLVVLDTPISETFELLDAVGAFLEDGCVVTDVGTTKIRVMQWTDELLPAGVSYVGGHPLLKKPMRKLEDSSPFAFDGVSYCIIPSSKAKEDAVKTVVSLAEMLGAKPLFLDAHEHDSYAVAMTYLPMVVSSALVKATTGSDSWREMHRLAAVEFEEYSKLASNDPQDNEAAALSNPDAMVFWIDQLITELYGFRNQIKNGDEMLLDSFVKAWEGRARWEANAVVEHDGPRLPTASESMAMAFFGERLMERYRQMTGGDEKKKRSWKYFGKRS
ncbi:MAG: prephenate dehydrogenase/arogenate dehydrogenase family protein [Chloroflexi bacterium]|nr:prephenate dehydrogenase/arogenate dehydrogenase family protein [Chloroflexota bacterium]